MGNLFCKTDDEGKKATTDNSDPDFHQSTDHVEINMKLLMMQLLSNSSEKSI